MSSPSDRYAAAQHRNRYPGLRDFQGGYDFAFDDFQVHGCEALEDGYSVLVCAPTGAGKTVVGEFAVHLALRDKQKCFYTTPIKALSNQKYNDLVTQHGAANVGLLTGDTVVNSAAPVIVMTTEVLRNMLYLGSSSLSDLGYVVMDEVHYLGDRFRGAVWEEVIIHLPASVRLVSLSATVSNAEEFGEWLVSVRGHTTVVVHERRPVPLWQHMLVGHQLFDLFTEDAARTGTPSAADVEPQLLRVATERAERYDIGRGERYGTGRDHHRGRHGGHGTSRGWRPPYRPDVITRLDSEGLLPAITFIFSRAGCDAAVLQCAHAGLWLTTERERDEIDAIVAQRTANVPPEDLDVLGYWDWREGLRRGIAAHHAGLLPTFKETVEDLFVRGLVRAVFATETLALGINMPARSVILERMSKFNGETHADITPGEYTQLTGRAGRRGIDVEGHAVVLWSPEVDPRRIAGLASTRTYPLISSFRPSYNMAVNLVGQMGRSAARELLESSFAQFQADRSVSGLVAQIKRNEATLRDYEQQLCCDRGDFAEYFALRAAQRARETELARATSASRRAAVTASLEALRPGDVIRVPGGRRAGLAVVIDAGTGETDPRPLVVTEARWGGRLSVLDFPVAAEVLGTVRVPHPTNHRSPADRRDLASRIRALDLPEPAGRSRRAGADAATDSGLSTIRSQLREHPCHQCPDREAHARWAERHARLVRETDGLRHRIDGRTTSLGRTFDRICALLSERGYIAGDETTPAGRQLARIWSESDLVVAECLRAGAWDGLQPAELAAVVCALVYEPRRDERADRAPVGGLRDEVRSALAITARIWSDLADAEQQHDLDRSREPEPGLVWPLYRWARGDQLERVLGMGGNHELTAGDFIRWCKQVIDLLDQLAAVPDPDGLALPLAGTARAAVAAVRRGVVAQSMQP
jgi:ATP-dependent RNA helicase HelY